MALPALVKMVLGAGCPVCVLEKKLPEAIQALRATQAASTPITLMFQDEARFGRINDVRRCWAPKPIRPLCQAMLTHEYTYAYAAV